MPRKILFGQYFECLARLTGLTIAMVMSISSSAWAAPFVHLSNDVGANNGGSYGSITLTVTSTGASHLLVVGVDWSALAAPPTVSDNQGNTYHQVSSTQTDGAGEDYVTLFYSNNSTAGVTSVTVTSTSQFSNAVFSEFSGGNVAYPTDGAAVGAAPTNTTLADSGAFTPSEAGDLLICIAFNYQATVNATPGTGFTGININNSTFIMEYQVYSSVAAIHGTALFNVSSNDPTVMQAFAPTVKHKVMTAP
jgi:hypothetical protein